MLYIKASLQARECPIFFFFFRYVSRRCVYTYLYVCWLVFYMAGVCVCRCCTPHHVRTILYVDLPNMTGDCAGRCSTPHRVWHIYSRCVCCMTLSFYKDPTSHTRTDAFIPSDRRLHLPCNISSAIWCNYAAYNGKEHAHGISHLQESVRQQNAGWACTKT